MKSFLEQIGPNNQATINNRFQKDQRKVSDTEYENYASFGQLTTIQDNKIITKELIKQIEGLNPEIEKLKNQEAQLKKIQEDEDYNSKSFLSLQKQIDAKQILINSLQNLLDTRYEKLIDSEADNIRLIDNN